MAIKKKNIKDLNWNSIVGNIPTATSINNGLLDKSMYSKASYSNTKYAQIAKLGKGGITGMISLFKDHSTNVSCIFIQCFNGTNIGVFAKKIVSKDVPNVKLYYNIIDSYMYLYTEAGLYFCHGLTILGSRQDGRFVEADLTARSVESLPEGVIEVTIE